MQQVTDFLSGKTVQRGIPYSILFKASFTNISLLKAVQILQSFSLDDEKMMEVPLISFWKLLQSDRSIPKVCLRISKKMKKVKTSHIFEYFFTVCLKNE